MERVKVGDYVQIERAGVAVISKKWFLSEEKLKVIQTYHGISEAGQQRITVRDKDGYQLMLDATRWKKATLSIETESQEL